MNKNLNKVFNEYEKLFDNIGYFLVYQNRIYGRAYYFINKKDYEQEYAHYKYIGKGREDLKITYDLLKEQEKDKG